MTTSLPLHAAATRLGAFCWTERRLFEVLGAAAGQLGAPAAKLLLDRHAAHAAWRAEQWWARLPVLAVVDRDALVVAASPGLAALYDRLAATHPDAVGTLAGAYRVALPRLAAAYRRHRQMTAPVADGPVRRTLAQVERDVEEDRAEGEDYLQTQLDGGEAIDAAAAAVARLERLLAV